MSFQSIIMSNRKLTNLFMSSMPASFWQKQGQKNALKVFHAAANKVPAYRRFLADTGIDASDVGTMDDFKQLPIIDKKNYISKYPLPDLCIDGEMKGKFSIEESSGYSGDSFLWPRIPEEDELFPQYLRHAFVQFYGVDKMVTLVIVTLAMGTWVSGAKMSQALRIVAANNSCYMTIASPGANLDDTLAIVEKASPHFDQTIIVGYPPFIKTVIDEGEQRGIDWRSLNVKIGLGGESYSVAWKRYLAQRIGLDNKDLLGISGGYGAADVGMSVGREYPLTALIREVCYNEPNGGEDRREDLLSMKLFGSEALPSLLQYNPGTFFIEEIDGELVFTALAGVPLVRYNIHDRGGVLDFDSALGTLMSHGYDIQEMLEKDFGFDRRTMWRLPLFYVFGRNDAVSISGMNVYPENIEPVLSQPSMGPINTFKLGKIEDRDNNTRLLILLEKKRGEDLPNDNKQQKQEEERYRKTILDKMLELNRDYKYVHQARPQEMLPIVKILPCGAGPFAKDKEKIKQGYIMSEDEAKLAYGKLASA
jgi:phenylacetate-CoA ligase